MTRRRASARAQDFERIAPQQPEAPERTPIVTPPAAPATTLAHPRQVVLPDLKGLKLLSDIAGLKRDGIAESGVDLSALFAGSGQDGLAASLAGFINRPATFQDLKDIQKTIVDWYAAQGRPAVEVIFPEQDISTGTIQTVVMEFHVGQVKVEGNEWFSTDLLLSEFGVRGGDPVDSAKLADDIAWLNQNPFRTADLVLEKGQAPGTTDLIVKEQDRLPVRIYAGYDNYGVPSLGRDRWNTGFNWGNAWGLDHQVSYQLTTSDQLLHLHQPAFIAHAVTYLVPLPWRDKLSIFGSWDREVPRLSGFTQTGHSAEAGIHYIAALKPLFANYSHELQFGYEFKVTDNNLQFGGTQVLSTATEIDQFPLIYTATLTDRWGQTGLENDLVWSPGNLTSRNNNTTFSASTPFATSNYLYNKLNLSRVTGLPYGMSWAVRVTGQLSNHNLLPSEQLGAGGVETVRGYDERVANGTQGVLASQELRTPAFSTLKLLDLGPPRDETQLLAFWDYGAVRQKQVAAGSRVTTSLESVGLGLRWSLDRFVALKLDYGWQLRHVPGQATLGQQGNISITLSY